MAVAASYLQFKKQGAARSDSGASKKDGIEEGGKEEGGRKRGQGYNPK